MPDAVTDVFGADATAARAYDLLTVDVPAASWTSALETARDELGCTYFDWLSAVDEPGTGFRVCAHVAAVGDGTVRRLLVRTTVPHDAASLPTAVGVYAGAAWHERETHEMFGVDFDGHPDLAPLLLPENFEGHPLRKDFVLAARVAKAWPGAKEPGESEHGGPKRRTMLPPGVPDPNEWGPLKGQLPPAPARPARGARAAGERPVRRARSASEGSAAQRADVATGTPDAATAPEPTEAPRTAPPRRSRSASQGSASQAAGPKPPASGAEGGDANGSATTGPGAAPAAGARDGREAARPGGGAASSADAPWHDARPAFDETRKRPSPDREPSRGVEPAPDRDPSRGVEPASDREPPVADSAPGPAPASEGDGSPQVAPDSTGQEQAGGDGSTAAAERTADRPEGPDTDGSEAREGTDGSEARERTDGPEAREGTDGPEAPERTDPSEAPERTDPSEAPERPGGPGRTDHPDRPAGGDTA
ncbi:NADH-quinone oxidoreductase subunit C [Streptomyces sp. NPDC059166]|uniref:NADH-quinone oxidoreductase subunit C n=1 Tax=Streptomyces sp. NPDC059166 TaxID=3346752 RepID=UPI0036A656BD